MKILALCIIAVAIVGCVADYDCYSCSYAIDKNDKFTGTAGCDSPKKDLKSIMTFAKNCKMCLKYIQTNKSGKKSISRGCDTKYDKCEDRRATWEGSQKSKSKSSGSNKLVCCKSNYCNAAGHVTVSIVLPAVMATFVALVGKFYH